MEHSSEYTLALISLVANDGIHRGLTARDCVLPCVLAVVMSRLMAARSRSRCLAGGQITRMTVPGKGGRPRKWLSDADRMRAYRARRRGESEPDTLEAAL